MRLEFVMTILVCFLALNNNLASVKYRDSTDIRPGYVDSLNLVVKTIKDGHDPSAMLIAYCIPETQEESSIFFNLDYDQKLSGPFQKMLHTIERYCLDGNENIMEKFIAMSQYVDGYFAEDYFDSAAKIYKVQKKKFCKIMKSTDSRKKERLIKSGCNCK
jgi:hypothetical protein